MKILVTVKQVVDASAAIRVRPDQTGISTENVKLSINPFDEIAVEEAVRLKETGKASEIVVLTVGPRKAQDALRTAIAMGADRGIHVETDEPIETLAVAKLVKLIVDEETPGLVLMGKQAIDNDCNQTGQMLAGLLGWGQATFANSIHIDGSTARITCEGDRGVQVVDVDLPVVITTDLRLNAPRFAALPAVMRARSKPLTVRLLSSFGVDVTSRLKHLKTTAPVIRATGRSVGSAIELVQVLKERPGTL